MIQKIHSIHRPSLLLRAALLAGAGVLAASPIGWLINTWRDPSYESQGFYIFILCAALLIWSATSAHLAPAENSNKQAVALLFASALIRLAGQLMAVNVIGAVALVIDVYAIALLGGVAQRQRALSPAWLALAFAFSLPLERIVQRTIGFGLQNISSDGACLALRTGFDNVLCEGIRIVVAGKDVLVDLPCSGARAITLLLLFYALSACVSRPRAAQGLIGLLLTLIAGLLSNIARITILASGIARPDLFFGVDVMAQPWHDGIGLVTLALGCAPVIMWASYNYRPAEERANFRQRCKDRIPDSILKDSWWLAAPRISTSVRAGRAGPILTGLGFIVAALVIVSLPRTPIDVARPMPKIQLPAWLNGSPTQAVALTPQENSYFVQYGGAAAKAMYGNQALLVVRTSAPLRHLHAPDECLRGMGFDVAFLGTRFTPAPTAVYRATDPGGVSYRIEVSFRSDDGFVTSNVAHAVWRWMLDPKPTWTAIQRITPWDQPSQKRQNLETAVASYFDLTAHARRTALTSIGTKSGSRKN